MERHSCHQILQTQLATKRQAQLLHQGAISTLYGGLTIQETMK
jgi:hypothetical protein